MIPMAEKTKYFAVSDIHSFCKELKAALKKAGYDKKNPNHVLIVCGDVFDRGTESRKTYNFLRSIPQGRLILIKGNHESLYEELLYKKFPEDHDFSNGTVRTFIDIAGMSNLNLFGSDGFVTDAESFLADNHHYSYSSYFSDGLRVTAEAKKLWDDIKDKVWKSVITKWLRSDEWKDYYELGNLIFVHSFIPVTNLDGKPGYYVRNRKMSYRADWRDTATLLEWEDARWGCPWMQYSDGLFDEEEKLGKRLVCGHWHTNDFHVNLDHDVSKLHSSEIYCGKGIIAIDGGVHHDSSCANGMRHDQNVLVIDGDRLFDQDGNELLYQRQAKLVYMHPELETDYFMQPSELDDICRCIGDCQSPCARKMKPEGIYTCSDFREKCKSYAKAAEEDI